MKRAQKRNAVQVEKFFFRKNLYNPAPGVGCTPVPTSPNSSPPPSSLGPDNPEVTKTTLGANKMEALLKKGLGSQFINSGCTSHDSSRANSPTPTIPTSSSHPSTPDPGFGAMEDEFTEYTLNEIINGEPKTGFIGLLGLVRAYLEEEKVEGETREVLEKSLDLISRRADGTSLPPPLPPVGKILRGSKKVHYKLPLNGSELLSVLIHHINLIQESMRRSIMI